MAITDNLTIQEAALESLVVFYDAAGIDAEVVIAEFGDKTKDELIEAYFDVYC